MAKSNLITKKIDELIELAKMEGEPNVQVVLLGLAGARLSNNDGLFAKAVGGVIENVMMPHIKSKQTASITIQN